MPKPLEKLKNGIALTKEDFLWILEKQEENAFRESLQEYALQLRKKNFGNTIYIRGLIEISNYCKNNCYYCGIRGENSSIHRYRLEEDTILSCVAEGYALGFRTFVLQGGEDPYYTDEILCSILKKIKQRYPDCAITLSLGERRKDSYSALFQAGADRYLLRHETATESHYGMLHPEQMSWQNRIQCLQQLKEIGYQVGCGFMVGSPFQTKEHLANDLLFLQQFRPHMVGIGPFIPQGQTPFGKYASGTVEQTLFLLSLIRILLPQVLLPATTALGSLEAGGREKGILAGANVVMPNLSPKEARENYTLYDNKLSTGLENAHSLQALQESMKAIGYEIVIDRGDAPGAIEQQKR